MYRYMCELRNHGDFLFMFMQYCVNIIDKYLTKTNLLTLKSSDFHGLSEEASQSFSKKY